MIIASDKVQTIGQFTDKVCLIRKDWALEERDELWFRGEKRDYGPTRLRPSLYRPPRKRSLKSIEDLLKIEDDLFDRFQRYNPQLTDTEIVDDFDGYVLMQHHGGPTRLLDWSDGSLTALHFATRNKQENEDDSLVYVLEPSRLMGALDAQPDTALREQLWTEHVKADPQDADDDSSSIYLPTSGRNPRVFDLPRIPMLLEFPLFTRRVAAQRSQFIVFGTDPSWLSEETNRNDSSIRTIIIDGRFARSIRAELRECGVTESVIFPDLDGMGKELNQLWEDRY
jgi:hypothetical protein